MHIMRRILGDTFNGDYASAERKLTFAKVVDPAFGLCAISIISIISPEKLGVGFKTL